MNSVEREFLAAQLALRRLSEQVTRGEALLPHPLKRTDLTAAAELLEGTYTVRLSTVFEAALMSFWRTTHATEPRLVDLINSVAAGRVGSSDDVSRAHHVRRWRNKLVHETDEEVEELSLVQVRGYVNKLLRWLPPRW